MLDLKELAFTAEDFKSASELVCACYACVGAISDAANRILAEKLARAEKINLSAMGDDQFQCWDLVGKNSTSATHTGRLVCVEKLEKPE